MMPACRDHLATHVAFAEQKVVMLDQPRSGRGHEVGLVEHGGRFASKINHKPAFRMRGGFAASGQPQRRRMVLEQSPPTPAIEDPIEAIRGGTQSSCRPR